jgi:hypothetical protein
MMFVWPRKCRGRSGDSHVRAAWFSSLRTHSSFDSIVECKPVLFDLYMFWARILNFVPWTCVLLGTTPFQAQWLFPCFDFAGNLSLQFFSPFEKSVSNIVIFSLIKVGSREGSWVYNAFPHHPKAYWKTCRGTINLTHAEWLYSCFHVDIDG